MMQFVEQFMVSMTIAILLWIGSLILMIWRTDRPKKDEHRKKEDIDENHS